MFANKKWLVLTLASIVIAGAAPAYAQEAPEHPEQARAAAGAAGDPGTASEPGSEHHTGGPSEEDHEVEDPSQHFNYVGIQPGHVFDYRGKDEMGGVFGDGQMVDPKTGAVLHEEEPASPPFLFMLFNFAILLGLVAWKGLPIGRGIMVERHDLIKNALDEAAKLRKQAADKLAEYEGKLKDADQQIKDLVSGMRADAEADQKRIRAAAEVQAAQMKRDAEQRIAAEIEAARTQLTREVTAAATAATEKLLREKMTPGDQQKLVASFIADVQTAVARPGEVR